MQDVQIPNTKLPTACGGVPSKGGKIPNKFQKEKYKYSNVCNLKFGFVSCLEFGNWNLGFAKAEQP